MLHDYYETIVQTEEVCTIYAHSPAYRLIINIDFIETTQSIFQLLPFQTLQSGPE